MGRVFRTSIESSRLYTCAGCGTHFCAAEDIQSKNFTGKGGRAYLVCNVENVGCGPEEDRILLTGSHRIAEVYCNGCGSYCGWKYISTQVESQRYKVGHFVIERCAIQKFDW